MSEMMSETEREEVMRGVIENGEVIGEVQVRALTVVAALQLQHFQRDHPEWSPVDVAAEALWYLSLSPGEVRRARRMGLRERVDAVDAFLDGLEDADGTLEAFLVRFGEDVAAREAAAVEVKKR